MKRITIALLLMLMAAGVAQAASDLPAPEKIIDKFLDATGGEKALKAHKTAHAVGTFAMPAMGISATVEVWQQAPNLTRTSIVSDAFGTMAEGFNGEIAWESNMMTGAKVKEGVELALARRMSRFTPWLNWEQDYQKATTLASETVDDTDCWVVEMIPNEGEGEPEKYYFAKDSGLLLKTSLVMKSEMGVISVESYAMDYREQQGITMPFKTRQVLMGMQEIVMTMEEQEFDLEVPAGTFDLPAEVQALLEESK